MVCLLSLEGDLASRLAPGALPATSLPKNSVTRIVLSGNVGLCAGARRVHLAGALELVVPARSCAR